jgi:hypothetical protein
MHYIAISAVKLWEENMVRVENRFRQRIKQYRSKNLLKSKLTIYVDRRKTIRKLLYKCCKEIWDTYFHDDLKAPLFNAAKPASLSKPSMNFYFGVNLRHEEGRAICRAAYATGSGASSIGLNPKTMTINHIFGELADLMHWANEKVLLEQEFVQTMRGKAFNFCSVKMYFTYRDVQGNLVWKDTQWHVDVTTSANGMPKSNNSQVPGTPVAIVTFGEPKFLYFRKHHNRHHHKQTSEIKWQQLTGTLFLLHPDDELPNEKDGMHWRHKSEMSKESPDNVTFSFMFRVVQHEVVVDQCNGTLWNPEIARKKEKVYERAEHIFRTEHYKWWNKELAERMDKFFSVWNKKLF